MNDAVAPTYHAFLSYAHADRRWGNWLHGKLEAYAIDGDLVGRATSQGSVPKRLYPVFRDRTDFAAGQQLSEATTRALDGSRALIVICSPRSALRPAVIEEVRLFRWRHPQRLVIPVLIDGTYPENVPPSLRYEIETDGTVSTRPVSVLGVDLREASDGRQFGLAKIVAGLIGCGPDELVKRAQRAQRRRTRAWLGGMTAVTVGFAGLAVWAEQNRQEAVAQRNEATQQRRVAEEQRNAAEAATKRANDATNKTLQVTESLSTLVLRGLGWNLGVYSALASHIAGYTSVTIDQLLEQYPTSEHLLTAKSVLEAEMALRMNSSFSPVTAERMARKSAELSLALLDKRFAPSARKIAENLLIAGDVLRSLGKFEEAARLYGRAVEAHKLIASDESEKFDVMNGSRREVRLASLRRLGELAVRERRLEDAKKQFEDLEAEINASKNTSGEAVRRLELGGVHRGLGVIAALTGDADEALRRFKLAFDVLKSVLTARAQDSGATVELVETAITFATLIGPINYAVGASVLADAIKQTYTLTDADPGNGSFLELRVRALELADKFGEQIAKEAQSDGIQAQVDSVRKSYLIELADLSHRKGKGMLSDGAFDEALANERIAVRMYDHLHEGPNGRFASEFAEALGVYSNIAIRKRRFDVALDAMTLYRQRFPEDRRPISNLRTAFLLAFLGRMDEADAAAGLDKQDPEWPAALERASTELKEPLDNDARIDEIAARFGSKW